MGVVQSAQCSVNSCPMVAFPYLPEYGCSGLSKGTNRGAESSKASQKLYQNPRYKWPACRKYNRWCIASPRDLQHSAVATALNNLSAWKYDADCAKSHLPARQLGAAASTVYIQFVVWSTMRPLQYDVILQYDPFLQYDTSQWRYEVISGWWKYEHKQCEEKLKWGSVWSAFLSSKYERMIWVQVWTDFPAPKYERVIRYSESENNYTTAKNI